MIIAEHLLLPGVFYSHLGRPVTTLVSQAAFKLSALLVEHVTSADEWGKEKADNQS